MDIRHIRYLEKENIGSLALVLFVFAIATGLIFSPALFNDGDTGWHIAAGQWILGHWAVPDIDPFSFTHAEGKWTAHEWLAEAVMAAAFSQGSWSGLAVLTAGAISGLLLVLSMELRRWFSIPRVIVALTLVAAMLAPFMLARPHVLTWPLIAGWTIMMIRARERQQAPPLAAAPVMMLWANLHGSFVVGLVLIGVFALEALLSEKYWRRVMAGWGVFGLASLVLSLLTPHFYHGLIYPFQVSGMETLPLIAEWRPTSIKTDGTFLTIIAVISIVLLVRRPPLSSVRMVLMATILYMSFSHVRHQPLVAIIGVLLLAKPLSSMRRPVPKSAIPMTAFAIVLIAVAAISLPLIPSRRDSASNPATAIRHVPSELRSKPMFNSHDFGGTLILSGLRPFIDGRSDMYGDSFMMNHWRIINGDADAFHQEVKRRGIAWTVLAPNDPLVRLLDVSSQWRRIYVDRWAVVHAQKDAVSRFSSKKPVQLQNGIHL